jgi:1,6-anhydro-N-acetylmuramate kinase
MNQKIKKQIQSLSRDHQSISLYDYGELDTQLGLLYAQCCLTLLRQVNIKDTGARHEPYVVFFAHSEILVTAT